MKLWRAKTASFASSPASSATSQHQSQQHSFLAYFASTTPDSPAKRTRLKAALFLQTSKMYDAMLIWGLLDGGAGDDERRKVLALERAVVLGKVSLYHAQNGSLACSAALFPAPFLGVFTSSRREW